MAFEATRFSESGLQLLAQLTTSQTLKIKHVYVDSVEHDIEDLEQPPSWWATETSSTMASVEPEIILAGAKETQARLRVKLSLKSGVTTTQTIKTIVICACAVESGAEGEEITFCGVMDSTGVEVLYHSGSSIKTSTGVSIYFKFSNASSISIETMENPDFVTASDLDRFVSAHKVSSASEGEEQDIYGAKFFVNLVADMYNGLNFGEGVSDLYFNITCADWFMCFNAYNEPPTNVSETVYSFRNNDLDVIKVELNRIIDDSGVYVTTFRGQVYADSIYTSEIGSSNTYIRVVNDILPEGTCSLGSQNAYFNGVYSNGYHSRISSGGVTSEIVISEGLKFSQYTGTDLDWISEIKYKNGQLTTSVQGVDCMSIDGQNTLFYNKLLAIGGVEIRDSSTVRDILPYENTNKLGDSMSRFGGVWAEELHGSIPTAQWGATNYYSGEKGSVLCVKQEENDASVERKPGDEFIPSSITSLRVCALDGTHAGTAPYGYYKALTYTDGSKPFLVIFLG